MTAPHQPRVEGEWLTFEDGDIADSLQEWGHRWKREAEAQRARVVALWNANREESAHWMAKLAARDVDLLALTAERDLLRRFAERMISPCEWGPSAFVEEDEADISDWAVKCGILVERVHAQPCEVEGCECDGSPTLLHFAWSPATAMEGK